MSSITRSLERVALGHWDPISENCAHPLALAYNQAVTNLQNISKEHELQKDRLRADITRHDHALKQASEKLNQAMADLKNAQGHIAQAEKQRSLSAVVSGFAHEINNPLTGILGYINLIELQQALPEPTKIKIENIKTQALRIKSIINELSKLDPNDKQVKTPINLCNLIEKLIKITLNKQEDPPFQIYPNLSEQDIVVFGNHFALWQVFEGVVENAIEAVNQKNHLNGNIHIDLRRSTNAKAIVSIRDDGVGFKDPGKAFDPFYTTKNRTIKRGIGLSLAYKIVTEHKGIITVKNVENGALVTIQLPLHLSPILDKQRDSEELHA